MEIIDAPKTLVKKMVKAGNKRFAGNKTIRGVYEKEIDGQIYCWVYDLRDDKAEFRFVSIISKTGKSTKSFDGKNWGNNTVWPYKNYNAYGAEDFEVVFMNSLDKDRFGKTVVEIQEDRKDKKKQSKWDKIADDIRFMKKKTRAVPKKIRTWMHSNIKHFIIFNVKDHHTGTCTFCGEQQHFKERLMNRSRARCPHCKKEMEVRTDKTVEHFTSRTFIYPQKIKEGLILRYVELCRDNHTLEEKEEEFVRGVLTKENGLSFFEKRYYYDFYGVYPRNESWEKNVNAIYTKNYIAPDRAYCARGYNPEYIPLEYGTWEDWLEMIPGWSITYVSGKVKELVAHPTLTSTKYAFCGDDLYIFARSAGRMEIYPIESLLKIGYNKFCENALTDFHPPAIKKHKDIYKSFGLSKDQFSYLPKEYGEINIKRFSNCLKAGIPVELCEKFIQIFDAYDFNKYLDFYKGYGHSAKKIIKYMTTGGNRYPSLWRDYLEMAVREGLDLTDEFTFFPRDLRVSHDMLVEMGNDRRAKETLKRNKARDEKLKKAVKKNLKKFSLEADDLFIRPAESVTEIVMEGQSQHNCVGTGSYAERMAAGKTMILFLRKKEDPDKSYYTVETDMDGNLRQAYAKFNKKTDDYDEKILPLLNQLKEKIQSGKKCVTAG